MDQSFQLNVGLISENHAYSFSLESILSQPLCIQVKGMNQEKGNPRLDHTRCSLQCGFIQSSQVHVTVPEVRMHTEEHRESHKTGFKYQFYQLRFACLQQPGAAYQTGAVTEYFPMT